MEGEAKKFKKAISQAKEGVKSRKRDIDDKNLGEDDTQKEQVNDSFIYNNAILILEDDNTNVNQVDNQQEVSDEEIQEIELQFQNLSEFFLWFVPVNKLAKDSSSHATLRGQFSDKILSGSLDDVFSKVYKTDKPLNPKSFDEIIPKIVSEIYEKDKNGWLVGFFVLCYAKIPENPINRDYFIIDNADAIVFKKDSKVVADEKQREDDIKTFSEKLKKDIPNVENLNQNPTISISDIETLGQGGQQDNFLQEILSNKDTMPNSYRLLNAIKQNPNSRNSDKYVEELNKWVAQENPKHVLSKSDLGKQLLPKLVDENGNLTVQDFNSLVQTCFENEELKKIVLDYTTSEDEEEPWWNQCNDKWIREKMQLMKDNGYI